MNHLALEIREVYNVKVHNAQPADARCGEIERQWRAKPTSPNAEHFGSLQLELTLHADLRHDQVPAIAQDLVITQLRCGWVYGQCSHNFDPRIRVS
jgi:hypothetical protein